MNGHRSVIWEVKSQMLHSHQCMRNLNARMSDKENISGICVAAL